MTIRVLVAGMLVLAGTGAVAAQSDAGTTAARAGITQRGGEPMQGLRTAGQGAHRRVRSGAGQRRRGEVRGDGAGALHAGLPGAAHRRTAQAVRRAGEGRLRHAGRWPACRCAAAAATAADSRRERERSPLRADARRRADLAHRRHRDQGRRARRRRRLPRRRPPVNAAMAPAELSKALDGYLAPMAAADTFAGVVLVATDGKTVFEKAYGQADRQKRLPITPATRFNVGSIGKMFTRTAIAQLLAQGKLALTDTIGTLLPDYPNAEAKPATVDQLLNHQAGIANFFGPEFEKTPKTQFRSNADYYRFVASKPLDFPPGTRTQYCNGCYVVLGAIIERVTGIRYEDYIAAARLQAGGHGRGRVLPVGSLSRPTWRSGTRGSRRRGLETLRQQRGDARRCRQRRRRRVCDGGRPARLRQRVARAPAGRCEDDGLDPRRRRGAGRGRGRWAGIGIAGGAPGCNAIMESDGRWTVVVVGNLDPPNAIRVGRGDQPSVDAVTCDRVGTGDLRPEAGQPRRGSPCQSSSSSKTTPWCRDADGLPRARGLRRGSRPRRHRADCSGRSSPTSRSSCSTGCCRGSTATRCAAGCARCRPCRS